MNSKEQKSSPEDKETFKYVESWLVRCGNFNHNNHSYYDYFEVIMDCYVDDPTNPTPEGWEANKRAGDEALKRHAQTGCTWEPIITGPITSDRFDRIYKNSPPPNK